MRGIVSFRMVLVCGEEVNEVLLFSLLNEISLIAVLISMATAGEVLL